jgi:hypothetical protein
MNKAQELYSLLKNEFPYEGVYLDKPLQEIDGVWMVDLFIRGRHIPIAWKESKGFGLVFKEDHGYGEGADETYKTVEEVITRIKEFVK